MEKGTSGYILGVIWIQENWILCLKGDWDNITPTISGKENDNGSVEVCALSASAFLILPEIWSFFCISPTTE